MGGILKIQTIKDTNCSVACHCIIRLLKQTTFVFFFKRPWWQIQSPNIILKIKWIIFLYDLYLFHKMKSFQQLSIIQPMILISGKKTVVFKYKFLYFAAVLSNQIRSSNLPSEHSHSERTITSPIIWFFLKDLKNCISRKLMKKCIVGPYSRFNDFSLIVLKDSKPVEVNVMKFTNIAHPIRPRSNTKVMKV